MEFSAYFIFSSIEKNQEVSWHCLGCEAVNAYEVGKR